MRYLVTTILLNARRGSEQYQSMNWRIAWSYERCELTDGRLFRTADFECSRSGSLSTDLGAHLRFLAIAASILASLGHVIAHLAARWRIYRDEVRTPAPSRITLGVILSSF